MNEFVELLLVHFVLDHVGTSGMAFSLELIHLEQREGLLWGGNWRWCGPRNC